MPPRALLLSKQGIEGLDFLISSEDSNSLFGMYSTGECKYSLMLSGNTVVRSLDLQLQLHIQSYVAMGGEGGKFPPEEVLSPTAILNFPDQGIFSFS